MNPVIFSQDEVIEKVTEVLRRYRAERGMLFGSYAQQTATETSDIDLLVIGGPNFDGTDIFDIAEKLHRATGKNVDVFEACEVIRDSTIYKSIIGEKVEITDMERLDKICEIASRLLQYIERDNITKDELLNQQPIQWMISTPMYNIADEVSLISDEFKAQYPYICWDKFAGLRHRMLHNYYEMNWDIIGTMVYHVLPTFYDNTSDLLDYRPVFLS